MEHPALTHRFIKTILVTLFLSCLNTATFADAGPGKEFVRWLNREMERNQVPAVSIAVIRDYKIEWALGFGEANIHKENAVTDETLFQAGSISKPVTAMAVLTAAQNGKLDLDDDVDKYLTNWKLPDNGFTADTMPTIAMLLSHSGGINVTGFRGYAAGQKIPSMAQILNGQPPANSPAIQVVATPGEKFMYSGGGYTLLQQILVTIYQKPFPQIMDDLVLSPLGMSHSTFIQPLPQQMADAIASPYYYGYISVPGGPHTYPEMAAAGLWTTPFDLAKFVISIQESLRSDPNQILDRDSARMMVKKQIDRAGLGFFVNMNCYGQPSTYGNYFLHEGQNEGYRSLLIASASGGNGAIIMTNMTHDYRVPVKGKKMDESAFIYGIVRKIAKLEGW